MALRYVGVRVTDLERSLRFYTEILRLKLVRRGKMSHGGEWAMLVDPDSSEKLELNWYPPGHEHATPFVVGEGLDHLGFEVDDARAEYQRLLAAGAKSAIEPWDEGNGEWVGYVTDPDGHWIEVFSHPKKRE